MWKKDTVPPGALRRRAAGGQMEDRAGLVFRPEAAACQSLSLRLALHHQGNALSRLLNPRQCLSGPPYLIEHTVEDDSCEHRCDDQYQRVEPSHLYQVHFCSSFFASFRFLTQFFIILFISPATSPVEEMMKRQKQLPLWRRQLDLVKTELKGTRLPRTAEEGLQQCAMLSAIGLRFLRAAIKREHPGASEEQIEIERRRLLAQWSAADARWVAGWRKDRARYFRR